MFIKFFNQISKNDVEIAGGKGASLGELIRTGIPVPSGFVILANAFDYFLDKEGLFAEVESELSKINFEDPNSVEETSERLRGLIEKVEMPEEIVKEIVNSYQLLVISENKKTENRKLSTDNFFVAVRSSATAEDSNIASWAGELETYLNTTEKNLIQNIKKCWSSLFTPRALFYRHEKGLIKDKVSVAVVVQTMIQSEISGICFTVHPVTKDKNQLVIEAGYGLGEAIVGGMITPDNYIVNKTNQKIVDVYISEQGKMIVKSAKGTSEKIVPISLRMKQKLNKEQIIELAEICTNIEKHYSTPQDIEWALEKNKFFIVQSRPITTL